MYAYPCMQNNEENKPFIYIYIFFFKHIYIVLYSGCNEGFSKILNWETTPPSIWSLLKKEEGRGPANNYSHRTRPRILYTFIYLNLLMEIDTFSELKNVETASCGGPKLRYPWNLLNIQAKYSTEGFTGGPQFVPLYAERREPLLRSTNKNSSLGKNRMNHQLILEIFSFCCPRGCLP